jgi:hypothetical protein
MIGQCNAVFAEMSRLPDMKIRKNQCFSFFPECGPLIGQDENFVLNGDFFVAINTLNNYGF